MKHPALFGYQLFTGLSDLGTGVLLCLAPQFTLRMLHLHPAAGASPFISYIGAFVLSVGMACLYGAWLLANDCEPERMEVVWLLTAFSRSAVAIYVAKGILVGDLEAGWGTVALFDATCVVIQATGLRKRWLFDAE